MHEEKWLYIVFSIVLFGTLCACSSVQVTLDRDGTDQNQGSVEIDKATQKIGQENVNSEIDVLKDTLVLDEKEVIIPDLEKEYKFVFVNDQHIIVLNGEYIDEKSEEVSQRYAAFCDSSGQSSAETWPVIVDHINAFQPDGVILNGDMIDFFSQKNLECLMNELKKIEYPTMYIRADHDLAIWYSNTISQEYVLEKERAAWEMEDVMVQEFNDFMIVGINNNTSQLSETGLEKLKELWELNKPVILAMHVPLKSQLDDGLSSASKTVWQDRALLWGSECYYTPDDITKQFLEMIYAEDSPVVAVLGAHLHFPYEDQLSENIRQIVFDASYKGTIGIVTVKGDAEW